MPLHHPLVATSVPVALATAVLLVCACTPRDRHERNPRAAEATPEVAVEPPAAVEPAQTPPPTAPPEVTLDWPTYQGDMERTGHAPSAPAITRPEVRWSHEVGIAGYLNAPLVVGELVLVPTSGQRHNEPDRLDGLHALDRATGESRWVARSLSDANGATANAQVVVFTSDDHHVRAIDLRTGQERWSLDWGTTVYTPPVIVGPNVVVGDAEGIVVAIDLESGQAAWERSLRGTIRGGLASDGQQIFVVTQKGEVAAFGADGSPKWRHDVERPGWDGRGTAPIEGYNAPVVHDGRLIVPFARDTYYDSGPALLALSLADGSPIWRARARPGAPSDEHWGNLRSSPAVAEGLVVWAEPYSGDVAAAESKSGAFAFRRRVGACLFPQYGSPVVASSTAYVPRQDGTLYAVDLPSGDTRWSLYVGAHARVGPSRPPAEPRGSDCEWEQTGGSPLYAPPAIARDGTLYVASGEGYLYAVAEAGAGG